jgi:hypothetical protein
MLASRKTPLIVPLQIDPLTMPDLGVLRQILQMVKDLRHIERPLTTAGGLRRTMTLLLQMAEVLGVDEAWQQRLRGVLRDEGSFFMVLGLLRFLLGSGGDETAVGSLQVRATDDHVVELQPAVIAQWLPLAIQLVQLERLARGHV